jgi:RHS repeat-associated protein
MAIPFVLHPDGSHDILPGAAFGTSFTQVVSESTGKPLAVGQYSWPYTGGMPGTMNHWSFNGDGSDTAYSPSPMPTVAADFLSGIVERGVVRTYLHTDGNRCLQLPASGDHNVGQYQSEEPGVTMMAWVRLPPREVTCTQAQRVVLADDFEAILSVTCNADGQDAGVTAYFYNPTGTDFTAPAGHIQFESWTHVAITWDKHTIRTFINGVQQPGSIARDGALYPYGGQPVSVGCLISKDAPYNFVGDLHDVALIRNPLAADQIAQFANGNPNFHFGTNGNWTRYRVNDLDQRPEVSLLPMPETNGGNYWQGTASGAAPNGTIVGYTYDAVGSAAMLYKPADGMHDLNRELPPGEMSAWRLATANGVNSSNVVVGVGTHNGIGAAYRFDVDNGVISEIPSIEGLWYTPNPVVTSINAAGHVAGYSTLDWASSPAHAFVYTQEAGSTDLNDLLAPSIAAAGWVLRSAHIYDGDVILGQAENTITGVKKGYKMTLSGLPALSTVECIGKADGTACTHGKFCAVNNICYHGVCGGGDPADNVCLRNDGIIDNGDGSYTAVLGYDNGSDRTAIPTINRETIDGAAVADPDPPPPEWFHTKSHPGTFLPTIRDAQHLTWRVNGQSITAFVAPSAVLAKVPIGTSGYGVNVAATGGTGGTGGGTQLVTIKPDVASYAAPPGKESEPQSEPPLGDRFDGVLTGKLAVTASGAATYTLPIAIPPGVAGMAPNLNLVYSSQGGDGLAGQGWDLTGLSSIYRCPKTRTQDGRPEPIQLGTFDSSTAVCLDGQRLFAQGDGSYKPEQEDHSKITVSSDGKTFTVVTKSGETRYYGLTEQARVDIALSDIEVPGSNNIVMWALDRVVDTWGNYYEIKYNRPGETFAYDGIRVTSIDYTGHVKSTQDGSDAPTFYSITFQYEMETGHGDARRPDVRWVRFDHVTVPKPYRLSQITTPSGRYELSYLTDYDSMLPSRLNYIRYCSGATCTEPMLFGWQGGYLTWQDAGPQFEVPSLPNRSDTAWLDVNGDGRPEILFSRDGWTSQVWTETYQGWQQNKPAWALPTNLADANRNRKGVLFADVDGDGKPDVISDSPELGRASPKIWFNRIYDTSADQWQLNTANWQLPASWGAVHFTPSADPTVPLDTLVDMDGDGRADLVRVTKAIGIRNGTPADIQVLISSPQGWLEASSFQFTRANLPGSATDYRLEDVNRDGLPDLVGKNTVAINQGWVIGFEQFVSSWGQQPASYDTFFDQPKGDRVRGDIDGDGLLDVLLTKPAYSSPCTQASGHATLNAVAPSVSLSTGSGFVPGLQYSSKAAPFLPPQQSYVSCDPTGPDVPGPFLFNLADFNGDGLADLVLGHPIPNSYVGDLAQKGQLFINNGSTWVDLNGSTQFRNFALDVNSVPDAPTADAVWQSGALYADIDGDGLTDVVTTGMKVMLNKYQMPAITSFPMGLAQPTQVKYVSISDREQFGNIDGYTYSEQSFFDGTRNPLRPGTRYTMAPLRVVSLVTAEDRQNIGTTTQTSYHYESLRADTAGRGPLGFMAMTAVDHATQTATRTTFAQAFPYIGRTIDVERRAWTGDEAGFKISQTHTTYCDSSLPDNGIPTCTPLEGTSRGTYQNTYDQRPFVYPQTIEDHAYSITQQPGNATGSLDSVTTTSFIYDEAGNPTKTSVVSIGALGDTYTKTTKNEYTGDSEKQLGKPTDILVTSTGPHGPPIVHHTALDYTLVNQYYPDDGSTAQSTLALTMSRVEPESTEPGAEVHTAYKYDWRGNVLITTTCASNFSDCKPGATNGTSGGPTDNLNPPFRTTTVSYTVGDYNFPLNIDYTALGYGDGRYPVKITDAAGHSEFKAYDPLRGVVIVETDPNGINTCLGYDDLGRQTSQTARCGSTSATAPPLTTTIDRYWRVQGDPDRSKVVTVTHPPVGGASWVFTDGFGQKVAERGRSFDGGFTEAVISYDPMGRVASKSTPYIVGSGTQMNTSPVYDWLNRLDHVTQDLGPIDGLGNRQSLVTTTYDGVTVSTDEVVNGQHQTKSVTRNALGKEATVTDAAGNTISYEYDADGNLTKTTDASNNVTTIQYYSTGRKKAMTDPDLGTWSYVYNGFGDLIGQSDGAQAPTSLSYDQLGRMIEKSDSSGTSFWVYDQGVGGVGKLSATIGPQTDRFSAACTVPFADTVPYLSGVDGTYRPTTKYVYTAVGQLDTKEECTDGEVFQTNFGYDTFGRQTLLTYPAVNGSRLSVTYNYTKLGFLRYLADASDGRVYWVAKAMNAGGQVTDEVTRNGVETKSDRDDATGWLLGSSSVSQADGNRLIQKWGYHFDEVGNLLWRGRSDTVNASPSEETFTYDGLNRLLTSTVAITGESYNQGDSFTYDALGNVHTKNGAIYTYSTCAAGSRPAGPHAVCSVAGGASYSYDLNGNMISTSDGRAVTYNASNKPTLIQKGVTSVGFAYGADGTRVVQDVNQTATGDFQRTVYVGMGDTGKSLYERRRDATTTRHVQFLYAAGVHGGSAFAFKTTTTVAGAGSSSEQMRYYHYDHLGSVTAVSDEYGRVSEGGVTEPEAGLMGYTPWGERRNPDGTAADPATFALPAGHRGFTGHEVIPEVGLINMNGRVYDPGLARFLTPDPNVQFSADMQSYNRYSYVLNNPLRYKDPTGYFSLEDGIVFGLETAVAVLAIYACPVTAGGGCALAVAIFSAIITGVDMADNGASWGQIVLVSTVSLVSGYFGGTFGSAIAAGHGMAGALVGGAVAGAMSSVMTSALTGQDLSAANIAQAALMGAVMGAFAYDANPVSRASAGRAKGRGASGEASMEAFAKVLANGDDDPQDAFSHVRGRDVALREDGTGGTGGNLNDGPLTPRNTPKTVDNAAGASGITVSGTAQALLGGNVSVSVFSDSECTYASVGGMARWGFDFNLSLGAGAVDYPTAAPGSLAGGSLNVEAGLDLPTPLPGTTVSVAAGASYSGGQWTPYGTLTPPLKFAFGIGVGGYGGVGYSYTMTLSCSSSGGGAGFSW